MKKVLFISDHLLFFKDEITSLKNLGYLVDTAENYKQVLSICMAKGYYHYSIIDLEFNNKRGDKLAIDLRYNLSSRGAIIGIYRMYLSSIPKTNYKITGFNYLTTFPVLDWNEIFRKATNLEIFDLDNKTEFESYIKRETEIGNFIYKKVTGKNPWTRSNRVN